jgi:DnaJ-class molecular chaperone
MAFQKCPVCNGSGRGLMPAIPTTNAVPPPCKTCAGSGIISQATGLPPSAYAVQTIAVNTDFRDFPMEQFSDK